MILSGFLVFIVGVCCLLDMICYGDWPAVGVLGVMCLISGYTLLQEGFDWLRRNRK